MLPDGGGGLSVSYLIDVGNRKVFVQGDGVTRASAGPLPAFDAVAEGAAYGRKRPRNPRRLMSAVLISEIVQATAFWWTSAATTSR